MLNLLGSHICRLSVEVHCITETSSSHTQCYLPTGAIYTNGGNVHMEETTSFDNNSADVGGEKDMQARATVGVAPTVIFMGILVLGA